jgi:hypothetical protein
MEALRAEQARLDALNSLDQLQQMVRPQLEPKPAEPTVPEPRRPAVVEEKIPAEMERQKALTAKAAEKQAAREKEPGYVAAKTEKQAHPAYKETYDKMIADGFDQKASRAAAYKAAEVAQKAEKAKEQDITQKLQESIKATRPSAATTAPAETTKAKTAAPEAPKPATKPETAPKQPAKAKEQAKPMEKAKEGPAVVTKGPYKVGDLLPDGRKVVEVDSEGRITEVVRPKKSVKPITGKESPEKVTAVGEGKRLEMSDELRAALNEAEAATPEAQTEQLRQLANNASLESGSGASVEALNRTAAMRKKGQQFVRLDPAGNPITTTEDGAVRLPKGWSFGILHKDGFFELLNTNAGPISIKGTKGALQEKASQKPRIAKKG